MTNDTRGAGWSAECPQGSYTPTVAEAAAQGEAPAPDAPPVAPPPGDVAQLAEVPEPAPGETTVPPPHSEKETKIKLLEGRNMNLNIFFSKK